MLVTSKACYFGCRADKHGCAAVTKSVAFNANAWQCMWLPTQHAGGVEIGRHSMLGLGHLCMAVQL